MLRWGEFALEAPEIAGPAEDLLRAFTLAVVATIRPEAGRACIR